MNAIQHEAGPGAPIQGVTLYSFTRAFHGREYDLEGLIRKVAAEGYGPGLEIIGFSSFRGFPQIEDSFAGWFRDLVDEVGLVTTSLAVNADIGIHRDRLLTQDELIDYMTLQIKAAAKLGFPIARVQISITPDSMEALAPIAEAHEVTLALEVHADQYASHPRILALRDRYEKVGSPYLGFTMDWGATVSGFAPSLIEAYRRRGASEELLT
jgi:sugar phosphate isomerase/epimerase